MIISTLQHKIKWKKLKKAIDNVLSQFVSQSIISKPSEKQPISISENFAYWQIPNILAENPKLSNIEILIKKEPSKNKTTINPSKTKVILKFETPDLGEVAVNVVALEDKLWYTFNTERESTSKVIASFQNELKDRMESINYDIKGFQTIRKKVDLQKYILPTQKLNDMKRISTEA